MEINYILLLKVLMYMLRDHEQKLHFRYCFEILGGGGGVNPSMLDICVCQTNLSCY